MKRATRAEAAGEAVDTRFLEGLLGYNARRAALSIIEVFVERMAPYGLRPVDFSVLSVIADNPGVTSRQLCKALDILPPNLVGLIGSLEKRRLISREPHPHDGRAMALKLTPAGQRLMREAVPAVSALEASVAPALTAAEHRSLIRLLKKVYQTG